MIWFYSFFGNESLSIQGVSCYQTSLSVYGVQTGPLLVPLIRNWFILAEVLHCPDWIDTMPLAMGVIVGEDVCSISTLPGNPILAFSPHLSFACVQTCGKRAEDPILSVAWKQIIWFILAWCPAQQLKQGELECSVNIPTLIGMP